VKVVPVILSGGSGKRLWPLSRQQYPKQYLSLDTDNTMLQETILRLDGLENLSNPIIICNYKHRFLVAEQCQQINIRNPIILLEPSGKNTAPAIAAAAIHAKNIFGECLLLVLSADHVIRDIDSFHKAINIARKQALDGKLATFGIVPSDAKTEYGYLELSAKKISGVYMVSKFVEKPNLKTAQLFLKKGNYLWNSGMFMFKLSNLLHELNLYSPDIIQSVTKAVVLAEKDLDFIRLEKEAFESTSAESIDYALMENSKNVVVVPLDAQWSDIGSWQTLYDNSSKDDNGNVILGDVYTQDVTNSFIHSSNHLVTIIGVDNLIVAETPDVTFITSKDKAKNVSRIVEFLDKNDRIESGQHRKVYRPWGWYDSIESGKYFQVKKLYVKPGSKLSLQMHHKRAEHWVVVRGEATVTNGEKVSMLQKGESVYIPIGIAHSLENQSTEPLEVIEVQSGEYLGEDDIVRFEDIYGRS
jgi:mannose-1-phosphate guanylyltransferase/mannose-6-phosphate isomerase